MFWLALLYGYCWLLGIFTIVNYSFEDWCGWFLLNLNSSISLVRAFRLKTSFRNYTLVGICKNHIAYRTVINGLLNQKVIMRNTLENFLPLLQNLKFAPWAIYIRPNEVLKLWLPDLWQFAKWNQLRIEILYCVFSLRWLVAPFQTSIDGPSHKSLRRWDRRISDHLTLKITSLEFKLFLNFSVL